MDLEDMKKRSQERRQERIDNNISKSIKFGLTDNDKITDINLLKDNKEYKIRSYQEKARALSIEGSQMMFQDEEQKSNQQNNDVIIPVGESLVIGDTGIKIHDSTRMYISSAKINQLQAMNLMKSQYTNDTMTINHLENYARRKDVDQGSDNELRIMLDDKGEKKWRNNVSRLDNTDKELTDQDVDNILIKNLQKMENKFNNEDNGKYVSITESCKVK